MAIGVASGKAVVAAKQRQKAEEGGKLVTVNQCVSAHDLRRSFGFRRLRRVMPAVLKKLMRHSSIDTTITSYVGQNAEATAVSLGMP